ncbi:MAG: HNH endonuclease [Candidatus Acidiferrales bacterium]
MKASDEELIGILIDLWTRTLEREGRRPFRRDLKAYGFAVSSDTFVRKYGSWKAALVRAADSVANESTAEAAGEAETSPAGLAGNRKGLSVRKRFFVFKRDKYRCRMCGASGVELEVDHVVSVADGGSDALDNLQTLCFKCNRGKRDSAE